VEYTTTEYDKKKGIIRMPKDAPTVNIKILSHKITFFIAHG